MLDYRGVQQQANDVEKQADAIRANAVGRELTAEEKTSINQYEITATSLASLAGDMQAREQVELRAFVKNGTPLSDVGGAGVAEFMDHMRTGREIQNAALSTTDANGGWLVAEPLHAALIEKVRRIDPIYDLARHFDVTGDAALQLPYKASHGAVANATETEARTEQTEPTFTSAVLTTNDYYSDQRATQLMIDSVPDMESMILGWQYADIYEQLGVDLAVGNGTTKASGLFAATSVYTNKLSGAAGAIVNTNFLTLATALHPRYRLNAVWLMNGATLAVVSGMGHPAAIGSTPLCDWSSGTPHIMGRPVRECASAPDIGAANFPVAYGDLEQGYAIGIHRSPTVLRDPFTDVPRVRFYALARMGGCPYDAQAILLLKSNAA